ncbi:MAG: PAS domain S-box protein, partial [Thioalkalispiraceae bacterium]
MNKMKGLSRVFTRKVTILFIAVSLLIVLTAYFAYRSGVIDVYKGIEREGSIILIGKGLISHFNEQLASDVLYLSDSPELEKLFKSQNESLLLLLANDWIRFSRNKRIYDQIRWIDLSGMERLRVNFNGGEPTIVAKQELSDKSKRYYFTETLKLNKNQFYISRFDLNVENGKIEKPHRSMIRICIPLFDDFNNRHGILVLNYLGDHFLDRLRSVVDANTWLVDEEGYWLLGPSPEVEWGFMYNRPMLSMAHLYPKAWQKILRDEKGHLETAAGYWNYLTIDPMRELNTIGNSLANDNTSNLGSFENAAGKWKLIHFIPRHKYTVQIAQIRNRILIYIFVAFGISILILFFIAQSDVRLYQSEQQQHAIIDSADFTIISTDVAGTIRTFNSVSERLLGYRAEEVIGKTTPEIIHDPEEVVARAKELSKELGREIEPGFEVFVAKAKLGIAEENDWTYIRKDKSRFPVRLSVTALKGSDGEITGFLGVGHDVSIRKAAEMELEEFRQRMALATESARLGVWEYDINTDRLDWNEWMYELYGLDPDTSVVYDNWENTLHPEDKPVVVEQLQKAVAGEQTFDTEYRIIRPDGEQLWIKANAILLY